MKLRTLVVLFFATFVPASSAAGQSGASSARPGPCPEDYRPVREFAERLLTLDRYESAREELGLTNATDEPLRILGSMRKDYRVCAQLYRKVPKGYKVRGKKAPETVVFYQIGNRYLLALTSLPIRAGESMPGPDQFMGFDLKLNKIGGVAF